MKNTNYAIIDHVGSLESSDIMKTVYKMAYDISDKKDTYTMKNFCRMISKNPNTRVSDKQKNFVRLNKHPEQVILICNQFNSTAKWTVETWAERVDNITIIEAESMEIFSLKDLHPEWFHAKAGSYNTEDSIYRRCAHIWSAPLGWKFRMTVKPGETYNLPVYRDYQIKTSEDYIRNNYVAEENKENKYANKNYKEPVHRENNTIEEYAIDYWTPMEYLEQRKDGSLNYRYKAGVLKYNVKEKEYFDDKISTNPNSYLKTSAVATEEECKEFFQYYKYVQVNGLLEEFLEPKWELCPVCGKPIHESWEGCDWCDYEKEDFIEIQTYYDDSYIDEDWD